MTAEEERTLIVTATRGSRDPLLSNVVINGATFGCTRRQGTFVKLGVKLPAYPIALAENETPAHYITTITH